MIILNTPIIVPIVSSTDKCLSVLMIQSNKIKIDVELHS